jgi:hypothetical protein
MARLEESAKPLVAPMLRGERVNLSATEGGAVAAWIQKTAMAFEFTNRDVVRAYYQMDERFQFRQTLRPPFMTKIWLARYDGDDPAELFQRDMVMDTPSDVAPGTVITGFIGHLGFQVVSFRTRASLPDWADGELGQEAGWGRHTTKLWPVAGRTQWPPPASIDEYRWSDFVNRWGRHVGAAVPRQ